MDGTRRHADDRDAVLRELDAGRVSIRTPPLAQQYGALPGIGQPSWIGEMLH